jgi:hypothetical protein
MFLRPKLCLFFLLGLMLSAGAQLPDTEIWLFRTEGSKTRPYTLKAPLNITSRPGYDHQPVFSGDGKQIYYTSVREDGQADIYVYEPATKKSRSLTNSRTSEYSPSPCGNGSLIASVVVETDSAQRIHFINARSGLSERSAGFDSVGYFSLLNADTIIYYKLTQPHSLRYHVQSSGEDRWLADQPLRTFKAINRHTLLFGIRDSSVIRFYTYDFLLRRAYPYAEAPAGGEDFQWHEPFGLVRAEGKQLLRFEESTRQWQLLFDLSAFPIKKISRFGFDPKTRYLVLTDVL